MNRSLRLPLAALGLSLLAACVVNVDFTLTRAVAFAAPGAGSRSDIAQEFSIFDSKEVSDHRANIKSLDLAYADVTVATVNSGSGSAVSGTLKLQRLNNGASQEVTIGTLNSFAITQGNHVRFQGSPAIDAFLMSVLNGDGKFTAVVSGISVTGASDAVLNVDLHASVGYDAGIL